MRHEHLVITVEGGIKERIDDDLGPGESLESWIADAIERKLAAEEAQRREPGRVAGERSAAETETPRRGRDERVGTGSDDGRIGSESDDEKTGSSRDGAFETDGGDPYREGFEYVDDCSI